MNSQLFQLLNNPWVILSAYVFGLLGGISAIYAFIDRKKNQKNFDILIRDKKEINWTDVMLGVEKIYREGIKKFKPDIIVSFSDTAMIVTSLVVNRILQKNEDVPPVFILQLQGKDEKLTDSYFAQNWPILRTHGWHIFVPPELLKQTSAKILLIVDFVVSGSSVVEVRSLLERNNFTKSNIKAWSLVGVNSPKRKFDKNELQLWILLNNTEVKFPWGPAY